MSSSQRHARFLWEEGEAPAEPLISSKKRGSSGDSPPDILLRMS